MLVTAPYDVIVGILRERAEAGVQVRILLAAPELVAKWRGQPMREKAVERIRQWQSRFRDRRSVTIRMCRTEADMELATCVSVDGGLVRLDICDPYRQRSLDGVMIEVESPAGYTPNVVRIFGRLFETAWQRSLRFGRLARTANFLGRWWKAWTAVLILAAAFLPISVPHWSEILIGVSCGVGAPVIIEDLPERYWTNRRHRKRLHQQRAAPVRRLPAHRPSRQHRPSGVHFPGQPRATPPVRVQLNVQFGTLVHVDPPGQREEDDLIRR
jgi:hypothetical protein